MRKVIVIAVREYLAAVRTKSFIISLVLIPLLMGVSVGIQLLVKKLDDNTEKKFAVLDRTPGGELATILKAAAEKHNENQKAEPSERRDSPFAIEEAEPRDDLDQQRYELSERVRRGDLAGFLELGPELLATAPPTTASSAASEKSGAAIRYYSKTPTPDTFSRWAERVVNAVVMQRRFEKAGIELADVQSILQPARLQVKGLAQRDRATGNIEEASEISQIGSILVPPSLVALMFMMVMIGATPLMQGVLEEKMQRIAEVLLGSVSPFRLMLGKLLGMVAVSLTIVAVYLSGAYWAAHRYGFTEFVPAHVLITFLFFQTLAVLMYGSLFIAIGAACTDARETQTLILPVALVACIPMFLLANVIRDPNSPFVTAVSLFPPATPMLMTARVALPVGVPWWQLAVGALGVMLTTLLCVYAAGRIFRVGLVMQGKGANIGELFRWVLRG